MLENLSGLSIDEQFKKALNEAIQKRSQEIVQEHVKKATEELEKSLTVLATNAALSIFHYADLHMDGKFLTIRIEMNK